MSVFPRNVFTALPAWVLLVLCAGCPGTELECKPGYHVEGGACVPDVTTPPPPPPNPCEPNPCTAPNKTVCSVSSGQAVCACNSGYFPVGDTCEQDPPPDCARRHSQGDAFEPDECPSLARPVDTLSAWESHTISAPSDEDWFRLSATSGNIYEVVAIGGSELRLRVDLYGADGTTVLASETGSELEMGLAYKARTTGNLFARIVSANRSTVGPYEVSFNHLGTDDLADEPAQATTVMTPAQTPGSGMLQFNGDVDVVRMKLEGSGRTYRIEASWAATPTTALLRLELLGTDGTAVLASSESATTASFIYRVATAGEYFLRLSERTGKRRESYSYTLTDLGIDADANTPAQATPATPSTTPTSSTLDYPGDLDVFSFQAQAGHIYQFTCDATVPSMPAHFTCDVAFVDAQGSVLKRGSTTLAGTQAVAAEFDTASTVYVRITTTGAFTDGGYKWLLTDLGVDDYGDILATATPVTVPTDTQTDGKFEITEDVDMLSFQAQAGHIYEFTCAPTNVTCNASILDATGSAVRSSSSTTTSSAVVQYKLGTTGTYYVRLLPVSPKNITTTYKWTLKDLGVDDHGDTLPTATAVTPSTTPTAGKVDFPGDEDWFSFQAQATQTLTFTCDAASNFNCNLYLMNAGGSLLTSDATSAQNAQITYRFTSAGTYYMRLASGDNKASPYTWQLIDQGLDDHGDTDTNGTALVLGAATSGKLQVPTDVDYFTVSLAANTTYTATLSPSNGVMFTVYGTNKASVLASGTGTKSFNSGTAAGTFYVKVAYQSQQATVTPYTITVAK
ncbi:PPC domain-containing protein [Archangium lansingense]|uniref:PPC domain-containing protein n=1 Tax=Archangium lansingense TaxID=2995310 RepID=A0ABT4A9D1_9BACT|nr:PPC domain-containing protein [Archangium lansinium]MCY1077946.1 PPC domain-containing protein [Archangium lansinium]